MSGTKVGFTAVADQGTYLGPNLGDTTVVFSRLITKVGDGYDQTSGIFTAPVAGLYYFSFFYHADGPKQSGLSLMKNGSPVVKAFDKSVTDSTDNTGNSAVLSLQPNDTVYVQLPAKCRVWAGDSATTFNGFLICEN